MNRESKVLWTRRWFVFGVVLCAALVSTAWPRYSLAQNEKAPAQDEKVAAEKAAADEKPAPAAERPAAERPAGQPEGKPIESFLSWVLRCSGLIGLVILLLSIYFVSTVTRLFWEMRMETAAPPEIVSQCESLLEQRDFKGIYGLVREDDSFFGRVLTTGIAELPNGLVEAREAMERVGEALTAEMEKKISMLAVLGTLGPMIGLLGTLKGMIASFGIIARAGAELKASEVAGGISEALLLTFEGVALSVPSIYFYALFRNRVIYIATSVMLTADQFLRHFSHAGRAKASTAAPVAAKPIQ
jgi:biopolymer transport protein ExbB